MQTRCCLRSRQETVWCLGSLGLGPWVRVPASGSVGPGPSGPSCRDSMSFVLPKFGWERCLIVNKSYENVWFRQKMCFSYIYIYIYIYIYVYGRLIAIWQMIWNLVPRLTDCPTTRPPTRPPDRPPNRVHLSLRVPWAPWGPYGPHRHYESIQITYKSK